MVISFEEKDRSLIESKGIMLIEFKRKMYNLGKTLKDCVVELAEKILAAWNIFADAVLEAADSVRMVIETVKDVYHKPTSRRYKIVKVFSKCTGTDIYFGWRVTWRIKRWVARSCL